MTGCPLCLQSDTTDALPIDPDAWMEIEPLCASCYLGHVERNPANYKPQHRKGLALGYKAGIQDALAIVDRLPDTPNKNHTSVTASWRHCRKAALALLRQKLSKLEAKG